MTQSVVFIQNISLEGPGLIGLFLKNRNIPIQIIDLYQKKPLPIDRSRIGAVVVLGGPMNVDEETRFPFLKKEKRFIRQCIEEEVPILGICLGAQLLADAFGAKVYKNQHPEIGCMDVEFTKEGLKNPLFDQIKSPMTVFQWHGDTFDLPKGAEHLAQSPACRHQAFSVNNRFYGLQFHIETAWKDAQQWALSYLPDLQGAERQAAGNLLKMPQSDWSGEIQRNGLRLCENFFGAGGLI